MQIIAFFKIWKDVLQNVNRSCMLLLGTEEFIYLKIISLPNLYNHAFLI